MSNNFKFCPVCGSHLSVPKFVPTLSSNFPIGKIIAISILILFLVGGTYVWFSEIGPEIQRVQQIQEDHENQPSYIEQINEAYSSVQDCAGVSGASPPEVRDRCSQVFRYSSSS